MTELLYDLELEREALGKVIMMPELLLSIDVTQSDFYSEAHAEIWKALVWLGAEGLPIHEASVRTRLADVGKLAMAGGDEYLLQLTDRIPSKHVEHLARLRKLSRLRALRGAAQRLTAACETADLDQAIGALTGVHEASLEGTPRNRPMDVLELCEGLLVEMERPPDPGQLFHPGYQIMREVMGLIPVRTTIGVLADTSVGKSSVLLGGLRRMAMRNIVVGYISVEDQKPRVRARIAGELTGVSSRAILQHQLNEHGRAALAHGFSEIDRLKRHFHVSILPGGTDADVRAAMSELVHRGCRVLVVDYLQKIRPARSRRDNKAHEVSDIATVITSHAQQLDTVLFLVSQCTRDKQRMNECPTKHDMKESGDLENMLDFVIGLWREVEDDYVPIWARLLKTKDGGLGGYWAFARNRATGQIEEIADSHHLDVPDSRGEWAHKQQQRRAAR